jgi:hypothetical protein
VLSAMGTQPTRCALWKRREPDRAPATAARASSLPLPLWLAAVSRARVAVRADDHDRRGVARAAQLGVQVAHSDPAGLEPPLPRPRSHTTGARAGPLSALPWPATAADTRTPASPDSGHYHPRLERA